MVTSITPGTSATQVMANSAGLNFINVVGSVCGAQALMSGSNSTLGCMQLQLQFLQHQMAMAAAAAQTGITEVFN
ncbi:PREDICTED: transcription factor SPT20 homolog [Elephantulus edwardii]|uniref:transcription factor SPT20 homolog n=1 Tax=Elephantulus edwardii TaxID=28737 RepID=UPI0003F0B36D|nr:PREDICTED: transcription factor SPT20 homolog [Elephantulus edwardii]